MSRQLLTECGCLPHWHFGHNHDLREMPCRFAESLGDVGAPERFDMTLPGRYGITICHTPDAADCRACRAMFDAIRLRMEMKGELYVDLCGVAFIKVTKTGECLMIPQSEFTASAPLR